MASKRRNMFYENKKQETTEIEESPFKLQLSLLRYLGILPPLDGGVKRSGWRLTPLLGLSWTMCLCLGMRVVGGEGSSRDSRLTAFLYASVMVHVVYKLAILPTRAAQLLALIGSLEDLEAGPEEGLVRRAASRADLVPKVFLTSCAVAALVGLAVSLWRGTQPFPAVWVPVPDEYSISVALIQTAAVLIPCAALGGIYSVLASLTANISTHLSILCIRFQTLFSAEDYMDRFRRNIKLHIELIRLVTEMNKIFGGLIFQEMILSSVQCCFAAYRCSRVRTG
ncbi:hypothetical protein AAG570_006469 [Ranatra chinensis]|uniref:Odorant receptor n=1 Tax=Ranatra chinensis TaxID=642074 RepID=A0ABD0YU36_9HEMI